MSIPCSRFAHRWTTWHLPMTSLDIPSRSPLVPYLSGLLGVPCLGFSNTQDGHHCTYKLFYACADYSF
ncbi:hypothetical protein GDO81_005958 [Engystomops pustulosus]|uniref:Uncharacterized protein n=1 Tax=Engystomops pustulosus TaxID=76066 RepID=A0AAV7CWE8_ENGPU|nr:hypothetical protein GDO81_005958 [Engystomops pustulosus]